MGDWLDEATSGTSPHNPQVQRLIACAKDPLEFMKYVRTRDEADAGANAIKAFPYWKDYIRLYTQIWLNNKQILVPKSRRVLMSWTNVVLFLWEALFRVERRYAFVSKKESDADELLSRCEFIYDNLDWTQLPKSAFPVGKKTYCQFRFNDTNSEILGFPHGSDQLRQYGLSGILADEMAFWDYAEAMYSSAFPTIQGEGGKILGRFVGISSAAPGFFQRLVFDQLDQDASLLIDTDAVKRDFSVMRPMTGVEMWRNPKNNYVVYQIHYTADPANRNEQAKRTRMQGLSRDKYLQEHEISWETKHGKPVFPDFDANEHVVYETIKPVAGLPLLRGWDFGLTPACIICQYVEGQLRVLKEITAEGMGAERFSDLVLESCRLLYPAWADQRENWRDFIDPSGEFRKDTDEGTCAKILDSKGLACVAGPVAFEARKGAVEEFLLKRGALKISAPGCSLLLRGFKGGYRYDDKVFEVEPQKVRPIKDVHSHIQDAFQMVCSRVKLLITRKRDPIPSLNYGFQQGARAAGVLTRPKVIRT